MNTYEHNLLDERYFVDKWLLLGVFVDEYRNKRPVLYWLPKLHKIPYYIMLTAYSGPCATTELSILLASCLTVIKNHIINYCEKVYEKTVENLFWPIKNS